MGLYDLPVPGWKNAERVDHQPQDRGTICPYKRLRHCKWQFVSRKFLTVNIFSTLTAAVRLGSR